MKDGDIEEPTRVGRASCAAGEMLADLLAAANILLREYHLGRVTGGDDQFYALSQAVKRAEEGPTCDTTRF